jgi:hypothetical protein
MPGGGCRHAVLAAAMAGAECTGPIGIWEAYTKLASPKKRDAWHLLVGL